MTSSYRFSHTVIFNFNFWERKTARYLKRLAVNLGMDREVLFKVLLASLCDCAYVSTFGGLLYDVPVFLNFLPVDINLALTQSRSDSWYLWEELVVSLIDPFELHESLWLFDRDFQLLPLPGRVFDFGGPSAIEVLAVWLVMLPFVMAGISWVLWAQFQ